MFGLWTEKHTRQVPHPETGSMWMNEGCSLRDTGYRGKFAELHGDEADPVTSAFDPEAVVLAGEGKRNGRLWIADGSVSTSSIPSLSQVRRGRKISQPRVETRPVPSAVALDQIRVCSSSSVIHTSLHVFHCNIHDIPMTKRRLRWPNRKERGRRPRLMLGEWRSR